MFYNFTYICLGPRLQDQSENIREESEREKNRNTRKATRPRVPTGIGKTYLSIENL